jgi:hypothetical protein
MSFHKMYCCVSFCSVILLSVIQLNVIHVRVILLSGIHPNFILLRVGLLSVILLNMLLCVVLLCVDRLNTAAPNFLRVPTHIQKYRILDFFFFEISFLKVEKKFLILTRLN